MTAVLAAAGAVVAAVAVWAWTLYRWPFSRRGRIRAGAKTVHRVAAWVDRRG